ncbi:hypothetical protein SAMN05880501_102215 [Ureibacillus xyleni]|uniref:Uncharacterized protein n=1 Tax=Ureibacillus xyleni TaxID=614648 RepID=A0A285RZ22_9BACL|nr:hypothetical protein [Ureibacillus xyleni]SOB99485.1 hypothetical protein SAMN05880501_102215 [Ureibacillus xyleni]
MEKDKCKELLNSISDQELIELTDVWKLKVKGFRKINNDNIKVARKLIVSEALKANNLAMISTFYKTLAEVQERNEEDDNDDVNEITNIRELSNDQLIEKFESGVKLHVILGVLYTSSEGEHHNAADEFLKAIFQKYNVQSIDELVKKNVVKKVEINDVVETKENIPTNDEDESGNERVLKKLESKNQNLQKQLDNWEQKFSKLKKEYKDEKQTWIKEKFQLLQDIAKEKSNYEKTKSDIEKLKTNQQTLEEEIKKYKKEIAHLHARLINTNKDTTQKAKAVEEKELTQTTIKKILIVGDPKNKIVKESKNPEFIIVNPKEIIESEEIPQFHEVWILDYLVPIPLKRKIIKKFEGNARNFSDFNKVKIFLEKGKI